MLASLPQLYAGAVQAGRGRDRAAEPVVPPRGLSAGGDRRLHTASALCVFSGDDGGIAGATQVSLLTARLLDGPSVDRSPIFARERLDVAAAERR